MAKKIDTVTVEVVRNLLMSIAEETYGIIVRSAYSTNMKERRDVCTAVIGPDGNSVAQVESLAALLGSMLSVVPNIYEKFGQENVKPGDMFIANDPYHGGGNHLPDIVIAAPAFAADAGTGGPFPVASAGDAKVARVRQRFRIFRILLGAKLAENHPGRGASAVVELAYRAHPLAAPGQRAVNILEDARVPVALGRIALEHHGYEQRAARTGERHVQQASRLGQGLGARIGR